MRVLVTDAEDRASLAAIRGLAADGHEVTAVAGAVPAAGHFSRAARRRERLPHPRLDVPGFVTGLERLLADGDFGMLVPASDASLLAVSAHRARLEPHVPLALPPPEVVERCFDKWELQRVADVAGLGGPETVVCAGEAEALAAARRLGFPVLVKSHPAVRLSDDGRSIRQRGSRPAAGEAGLREAVTTYGVPCLIQRHASGRVVSVGGTMGEGGPLALAFSRYERVFPPDGGAVCFSRTIEEPSGLGDRAARLVEMLGWRGMFELELLEHDNGYAAIDFNPRSYGSMSLAIAAGTPLPSIWLDAVAGRPRQRLTVARAGVPYRWEDADLRHALWQLRRGRVRAAARVMRPARGAIHPFFRLRDPLPLLARLAAMLRRGGRR
jgi:D-aspartate ligase